MEEIVALIGELLDCLPDSNKWEHDETWKWCWDELSDEAQGKVALVRRKAVILLLEIGRCSVKAAVHREGIGGQMNIDEANQAHDWVTGVDLPWCRVCGLCKISAHIWGDDEWTREPISCFGEPDDSEESKWLLSCIERLEGK